MIFKKINRIICISLAVAFVNLVNCQETEKVEVKENTWNLFKKDGTLILQSVKHAYTQPLKWEKDDWLTAGGIVAGTAFMYIYDEQTSEYFVNQNK